MADPHDRKPPSTGNAGVLDTVNDAWGSFAGSAFSSSEHSCERDTVGLPPNFSRSWEESGLSIFNPDMHGYTKSKCLMYGGKFNDEDVR
jgi:hypothetical protein